MKYKAVVHNVMRQYESARSEADFRLDERKNEIYEKLPRVAEIDRNLGVLGASLVRCALGVDSGFAAIEDIRTQINQLKEERFILLANSGMNDLREAYNCPICSDTGYVQATPSSVATRCSCLRQKLIDEYYALSNIKDILQDENFDHFDFRLFSERLLESEGLSPHKNMQSIYSITTQFVANFDKEFDNLLLYGDPGLGKTFVCHCIAKDLLDKGYTVLYLTVPRLCKVIEDYRFNREALTEPDEMLEMVDAVDLLILDDLGTEIPTLTTSVALFDIINQRLISRKHTVISTNLSIPVIQAQYSERIVSRLFGNYEIIKFFGEDIRMKKKYG